MLLRLIIFLPSRFAETMAVWNDATFLGKLKSCVVVLQSKLCRLAEKRQIYPSPRNPRKRWHHTISIVCEIYILYTWYIIYSIYILALTGNAHGLKPGSASIPGPILCWSVIIYTVSAYIQRPCIHTQRTYINVLCYILDFMHGPVSI